MHGIFPVWSTLIDGMWLPGIGFKWISLSERNHWKRDFLTYTQHMCRLLPRGVLWYGPPDTIKESKLGCPMKSKAGRNRNFWMKEEENPINRLSLILAVVSCPTSCLCQIVQRKKQLMSFMVEIYWRHVALGIGRKLLPPSSLFDLQWIAVTWLHYYKRLKSVF